VRSILISLRKHPCLPQGKQGGFAKLDAELRQKLLIGVVKAEVPAMGINEAKEADRGRMG
jgi:hypothetical protein